MAEKTEFLPFHAINEYMRPDFRLKVIRDTLNGQQSLDESRSNELNQQIKKNVSVPGFRNSDKAPALMKVVPTSKAFEKSPDLVKEILSAWAEINSRLRDEVFAVLKDLNWKVFQGDEVTLSPALITEVVKDWPIFPMNMDRTKLPGFYTHWPKSSDFEVIYNKYVAQYPDSSASIDTVSLMAVWLTMRLPFQVDEIENSTDTQDTQPAENSAP